MYQGVPKGLDTVDDINPAFWEIYHNSPSLPIGPIVVPFGGVHI